MHKLRKIFTTAALLLLVLALAACGGAKDPVQTDDEDEEEQIVETTPTPTPDEEEQDEPEQVEEPAEPLFETKFWNAVIPEHLTLDEENDVSEGDSYTRHEFEYRTDPESENADSTVQIYVSIESNPSSFRRLISDTQQQLADYANAVGTVPVAGFNCQLVSEPYWFSTRTIYRGRDEATSTELTITIIGDITEDLYLPLLESLTVTTPNIGHVDAPYPWDGERIVPEVQPLMVGAHTLTPEYLASDEAIILNDTMNTTIAVIGDTLYAVTNEEMNEYAIGEDKTSVALTRSELLDTPYEHASADKAGNLYLSPGLSDIVVMDGFDKKFQSSLKYDLSVHPNGAWGISFWVNSDPMKITIGDGVMGEEPWVLKDISKDETREGVFRMISTIEINDKHIIVAGTNVDVSAEAIVVYDLDGKELFMLANTNGDRMGIGSVTYVAETSNGFVATDGNMRDLIFWNTKGEFIGKADVSNLLGLRYCWLEDAQLLADGSLLIAASQSREDGSASELLFFRVSGF